MRYNIKARGIVAFSDELFYQALLLFVSSFSFSFIFIYSFVVGHYCKIHLPLSPSSFFTEKGKLFYVTMVLEQVD